MGQEFIRETKISVEVDTNKQTYRETFTSMKDAISFYERTTNTIYGSEDSTEENQEGLREAIAEISEHSCTSECGICKLIEASKKFLPEDE